MNLICRQCNSEFSTQLLAVKAGRKFCSSRCYWDSMRNKVKRACAFCNKEFETFPSEIRRGCGKYCSRKCGYAAQNNDVVCVCEARGKEFVLRASAVTKGRGKFCSCQCFANSRITSVLVKCATCGTKFKAWPSRLKSSNVVFCSASCRVEWHSTTFNGEDHWNWKGGASFEPYPIEFNERFKRLIRQRDGYNCAICRRSGHSVHHIDYDKQNTVPRNCITMCSSCHSKTNVCHRRYWQIQLEKIMTARKLLWIWSSENA